MHELSIALSIIDGATEQAQRLEGAKVTAVHLRLGPLSGVIKEALESAFAMARENTLLSEANLVVQDVPLIVHCPNCQTDGPPVSIQDMRCRQCGTLTPHIISGREMELAALEVVDESPATPA